MPILKIDDELPVCWFDFRIETLNHYSFEIFAFIFVPLIQNDLNDFYFQAGSNPEENSTTLNISQFWDTWVTASFILHNNNNNNNIIIIIVSFVSFHYWGEGSKVQIFWWIM
jgi:hypothetical protein